jgi:hypothetical protein
MNSASGGQREGSDSKKIFVVVSIADAGFSLTVGFEDHKPAPTFKGGAANDSERPAGFGSNLRTFDNMSVPGRPRERLRPTEAPETLRILCSALPLVLDVEGIASRQVAISRYLMTQLCILSRPSTLLPTL